jgi:hypothetical protein
MRKKTGMTDEVRECLAEMGVTEEVFAKIRTASNHTDGAKLLDEAKEICRKGFRAIAASYHPDHNQHLPLEEIKQKEDRFKRLRSIHDSFLESRYRGPARSKIQAGARNFDPFGIHSFKQQEMMDDLRHWDNPLARDIIRLKREEDRERLIKMAHEILNKDKK